MANNYATVPAIIPGNLTVQGNLTVAGGQFKLGALARKYRIQETGLGQFSETVNLDRLAVAQDDVSAGSQLRAVSPGTFPFAIIIQAAGVPGTDQWLAAFTPSSLQLSVDELRVGSAVPYVRLLRYNSTTAGLSVNLQKDTFTRDDTGNFGGGIINNDSFGGWSVRNVDLAGNGYYNDLRRVFWLDHGTHQMTGVTGVRTVASKTVYGNQLGGFGGMMVTVLADFSMVASGGITVGINFGGTQVNLMALPASTLATLVTQFFLMNQQATNQQLFFSTSQYGTVTASSGIGTGVIDTTANQTLAVTTNAVLAGDVINVRLIEADFIPRVSAI